MIWKETSLDLKINNLCKNEVPYMQPLVTASDLCLQGRLPKQKAYDYNIEIKAFDCSGETYLDDVTALFSIQFATSIYDFNYFNLKLNQFEGLPNCFTIQVEVSNQGVLLFNKITEPYRILEHSKRCYVVLEEIEWQDFSKGLAQLKINDTDVYKTLDELPTHFELQYQQGTDVYYLYHDCTQVNKIQLFYESGRAFAYPLGHALATDIVKNKTLDIFATYIIDESGCRMPYSKIESIYNCIDNITGYYYGDPKILLNYANNDPDIRFTNAQWLELELIRQPTELKKEVTYLGRTQRVDYKPLFKAKGLIPYPEWKMQELEALFSGRTLYIDSEEYILEDGELFKKDTIKCTCSWLLEAELYQKLIINEFSCFDTCNILCNYFVIYGGVSKDMAYYDENGKLIALTYNDLLNYFRSFEGVISVHEIETSEIECLPLAVIKIDSFGYVPSFIYYFEKTPANRIFSITTDCNDPEGLCDNFIGSCMPPYNVETKCVFAGCEAPAQITYECVPVVITNGSIDSSNSIWNVEVVKAFATELNNVTLEFIARTQELEGDQFKIEEEYIGTLTENLKPAYPKLISSDNFQIRILSNGDIYVTSNISEVNNEKILTINPITYKINNNV